MVRGGSKLKHDAPVLGLLFGLTQGSNISVIDSEEIVHSFGCGGSFGGGNVSERQQHIESIRIKIRLHQEVYPNHEMIGWYRVGNEVTPEDILFSQSLMSIYTKSLFFIFMKADARAVEARQICGGQNNQNGGKALPISVYETVVAAEESDWNCAATKSESSKSQSHKFLEVNFKLSTFEPEKISIENVFKAQVSVSFLEA